jgi:subtilisin family serine protease
MKLSGTAGSVDTISDPLSLLKEEINILQQDVLRQKPYTWGVIATKVSKSRFTGRGIKVAILDTGFDSEHPDYRGRNIVTKSFLDDGDPMDFNGHGTHCIGTAMGPKSPSYNDVPRYGCASEAEIYAGKVIYGKRGGDDSREDGFAWMSNVLEGITWAIDEQCRIINLSLGMPLKANSPHSDKYFQIFNKVSGKALRSTSGTLIVAATGNEGAAQAILPAYCDSILAVGAIDENLQMTNFSNQGEDILAPGVKILSSMPRNLGEYSDAFSGTSMAAAHVSGIAAMWAEALEVQNGEPATAEKIWDALIDSAKDGIVQAP